ncbi:MAG: carboxypeptidase-like regulatory domain-containing protein [Thermoanaerobaculia bacterium]|nr:carboxypeptidase-like regulatory domain-containing protein [Thermoanaerobaculia bacterium]
MRPEAGDQPIQMMLWPTATVTGEASFPDSSEGDPPPGEITIRFASPPPPLGLSVGRDGDSASRLFESEQSCPLKAEIFSCLLPATRLDLRLSAPDRIPSYIWDADLSVGEELNLGAHVMARGASLVGSVTLPGNSDDVSGVEVILEPEVVDSSQSPAGNRMASHRRQADLQARGFFQLRGLAVGIYSLTLRKEGLSPARIVGIEIADTEEYYLGEAVSLRPLASFEVVVTPQLDPEGAPWSLRLKRWKPLTRFLEDSQAGRASEAGVWQVEGLEAGSYLLQIEDDSGSKHYSKEIEIDANRLPLVVELEMVRVTGRVSAGSEPLHTSLTFLDTHGSKIQMGSNEHGEFQGVLPRSGEWKVKATPAGGRGQRFLPPVEVIREPDGTAFLDLSLPGTRVSGTVVDEEGESVSGALVNIWSGKQIQTQLYSDAEGAFEALGLPPIAVDISAEAAGGLMSQNLTVDLEEEETVEDLELVLQTKRHLRGIVTFEGRTVAGASVRLSSPQPPPFAGEALAGPGGRFELELPPSVQDLDVVVLAPGLPIKITRVDVDRQGSNVNLGIDPFPGRLILSVVDQPWLRREQGNFLPFWQLFVIRGGQPPQGFDPSTGSMELLLESGEYTVCPGGEVSDRCASGYLAPDGLLRLGAEPGREGGDGDVASP